MRFAQLTHLSTELLKVGFNAEKSSRLVSHSVHPTSNPAFVAAPCSMSTKKRIANLEVGHGVDAKDFSGRTGMLDLHVVFAGGDRTTRQNVGSANVELVDPFGAVDGGRDPQIDVFVVQQMKQKLEMKKRSKLTLSHEVPLLRKSQSASFSEEKIVAVGRWSNNSVGSLLLRSKYALMTGGSSGFQGISCRERRKGGFWGK